MNAKEEALELVQMLRQGHRQASINLMHLIALDDPSNGALFWFAKALAYELNMSDEPNTVYRAMLRASGVEL